MRGNNSEISIVTEIEAQEACKWLRAAGFPQYAQMYEGESRIFLSANVLLVPKTITHTEEYQLFYL